jgi:hypothetical protein
MEERRFLGVASIQRPGHRVPAHGFFKMCGCIEVPGRHSATDASMTTGYSDKTLAAKLGIKADVRVVAFGAPRAIVAGVRAESPDADIVSKPLAGIYQSRPSSFLWVFCELEAELKRALPALRRALEDGGTLWVSWPNKNAWKALKLDPAKALTEDAVREHALPLGLVDVKVCAVDEVWSGLKLMVRREHRQENLQD